MTKLRIISIYKIEKFVLAWKQISSQEFWKNSIGLQYSYCLDRKKQWIWQGVLIALVCLLFFSDMMHLESFNCSYLPAFFQYESFSIQSWNTASQLFLFLKRFFRVDISIV